jgi:hypothetical protein
MSISLDLKTETDPVSETLYFIRRMPSSGMLRFVDLVGTEVSEEYSASIIRVTGIGELRTTSGITSISSQCSLVASYC